LVRERITGLAAVPPLWIQLAALEWPASIDEHLRYFTNSGGAMPTATLAELRRRVPSSRPYLMYGLTEAFRSTYLPPAWGWALAGVGILAAAAVVGGNRRRRRRYGLAGASVRSGVTTLAVVAVVALGGAALLNSYFGVPWMLGILVVLLAAGTVLMRQTTFGQHVYAIGGTSLVGGRGRIYQALLGALVVGSVQNGLDLLGQPAAIKNISTGVILVIAVVVDAIGRRRRLDRGAFD
ncbi:MAG: hypothetical protein J0I40_01730, partial [Cellulomonas sp.]|nr:hypothetical protein [Cellulomonas sp.]